MKYIIHTKNAYRLEHCTTIRIRSQSGTVDEELSPRHLFLANHPANVMSTVARQIDERDLAALQLIKPPVRCLDDLFTRDGVKAAHEASLTLHGFSSLKSAAARNALNRGTAISVPAISNGAAWKALPGAIPPSNSELPRLRPTGIQLVDEMFSGGLPASTLVSIVANSGCGKSYLSASAVAASALQGHHVVFLTTGNDVNVKRIQAAIESLIQQNQDPHRPYSQAQYQDLLVYALSNITVVPCFDLWTLLDLVAAIRDHTVPDLLVIDSLQHVILPLLSASGSGGGAGALARNSSVSADGSVASGSAGATASSAAFAASELLNSLLTQLVLLLRNLVASQCTVLLTNAPPAAGMLRRTSTTSTTSTALTTTTSTAWSGPTEGLGMSAALLDCVDISLTLEKVEGREEPRRAQSLPAGQAGGSGDRAANPTILRVGKEGNKKYKFLVFREQTCTKYSCLRVFL